MTIWQRIAGLATALGDYKPGQPPSGDGCVVMVPSPAASSPDGRNTVAFTMAVIALGAKMAKADGIVSPVEVAAFHQVFKTPASETANVERVFELAQRDIAGFETYASQVRDLLNSDPLLLRDVLESLFHIASADRALHPGEEKFLSTVATVFGLSESTFRHVRAQFVVDPSAPYDVFGLDPSVTDAELKTRYRKLVRDYHPDLLAGRGLPAEMIEIANRKLAAITAAYAVLARERGL